MKHLFIPYEIALKLKEKGFDEPCLGWYTNDTGIELRRFDLRMSTCKNSDKTYCEGVTAPLYQQVIDWFREKKNIHIQMIVTNDFGIYYGFVSCKTLKGIREGQTDKGSYYESLTTAITKAIELI